jgi:sugar lactone lactonase YvrE
MAGQNARFGGLCGLSVDATGNVYVADGANHTIRRISGGLTVTTIAGWAGQEGSTNGVGSSARFRGPYGITVGPSGNVYVADSGNHTIRKISPSAAVSTVAGVAGSFGSTDGTGSEARFRSPMGLAADSTETVYVADSSNNTVRKVTPAGVVSTRAGSAGGGSGSVDGTGSSARFNEPRGVAVDAGGNIYVADQRNHTIRKVSSDRSVTTFAGLARAAWQC